MRNSFKTAVLVVAPFLASLATPAFCQSAEATVQQCHNFPVFPTKISLWANVLSPNNSEILAILNNRPIGFNRSERVQKQHDEALPLLEQALRLAKEHGNHRDTVDCLCNLGCLYYLAEDFSRSEAYFDSAISFVQENTTSTHPILAPLNDYKAMAIRQRAANAIDGERKKDLYERVEKLYTESLSIRAGFFGYYHADTAHSLMNLSLLYRDRATEWMDAPSVRKQYARKAQELETRIDELMNPNLEMVFELRRKAIQALFASREETDPDRAFALLQQSRALTDKANKFAKESVQLSKLR